MTYKKVNKGTTNENEGTMKIKETNSRVFAHFVKKYR